MAAKKYHTAAERRAAMLASKKRYRQSVKGKSKSVVHKKRYRKSVKGKSKIVEHRKEWVKKTGYRQKYKYLPIEKSREYRKRWRTNNPEKYKEANRVKKRRKMKDVNFRLIDSMRKQVWHAVRRYKGVKETKTANLIGIKINEFRKYLELKFKEGMSWDNYGSWHIDHIKPVSHFNFQKDKEELKKCFHYTNLQPMWAKENARKGNRWVG